MVEYKDTLNLPQTAFEMRANLAQKEPKLLEAWRASDLYGRIGKARANAPRFVLHDGPPYANGTLHHGHILNKILKDIVVKDRTMAGFSALYVPGWDCHGLPIEVQVDKELGAKKASMSAAEVRAACRAYAARFVDIQRDGFRRLGVFGRWNEPYLTMNFGYEATTLRQLADFVEAGLCYKGLRPVNWCTVHQTALAEAEVEYEDKRSPSAYVAFPLAETGTTGLPANGCLAIWTTTPWTLPANLAVALHPEVHYVAYPVRGRPMLVAEPLLATFLAAVREPAPDKARIVGRWLGAELAGVSYRHALWPKRQGRVVLGEHVTVDAGTGCVHTAPGHGADDFEVGRRCGLEIVSGVDAAGKLTALAEQFAGLPTLAANRPICEALAASGALLNAVQDEVTHRYPHCWRCHKPIVLRATEQWFVALDKPFGEGASLRERALRALDDVAWVPSWGHERIRGMLAGRPDWCLSRQRTWGVPLAVLYCDRCNTPVCDADLMRRVANWFDKEGAQAWYVHDVATLCGARKCSTCGHASFRKETDILDVWFDSGTSFAAVVEREGLGHREGPPVDLYLEGSDQHRGWFHSSLLCSMATRQRPPYRQVMTHGFVVDGQGKKISKSKGNFVDPFKTISSDGAELLRLWVASENFSEDVRLSPEIFSRLTDSYRKIRNTLRYLLGNVHDFDPSRDGIEFAHLVEMDRYALCLFATARTKVRAALAAYNFHSAMAAIIELCTIDLSAFYLDVLKDRLYASAAKGAERRSAQTALYAMTRQLLRLCAPVLSFTTEEAWSHLPRCAGDPDSVHLSAYDDSPGHEQTQLWHAASQASPSLLAKYAPLREVRRVVNVALEEARRGKLVGSSAAALVQLQLPPALHEALAAWDDAALADVFIVSGVQRTAAEALRAVVAAAPGTKCSRCWLFRQEVGYHSTHPALCKRCVEALS